MWKYCDFEYRVTLYFKSSYPNQDYGYIQLNILE